MKRLFFDLRRYLHLAVTLLRHGLGQLLFRKPGPLRLRLLLEDLGATFVKLGQVLALQPDILPRAYCNELFDLMDRVPPMTTSEVRSVFRQELGRDPGEVFQSFEWTPMASASIGQVHRARFEGRRVAVKVQRPRAEIEFEADIRLMLVVAGVVRWLRASRLLWFSRFLEEFVGWTREELDYRTEARHMAILGIESRRQPSEVVPGLVDELTTRRLLVCDYLEGPTVLDYIRELEAGEGALDEELRRSGFDPELFAQRVIENFVEDAFMHGVFHADLHPANLVILPESVVGYVDFGITGSLSPYARRTIVAMTLDLTRGDVESLWRHFSRIARCDPGGDLAAYRNGLREMTAGWWDSETGEHHRLRPSFTRVMLELLMLGRRTGVWPTPDVVRYIRSVITADGLIQRFAPEFDTSRHLELVCRQTLLGELRRNWSTASVLADWVISGTRWLRDGPSLTLDLLRASSQRSPPAEVRSTSPSQPPTRAARLALLAFAASLFAAVAPGGLGWNLYTVLLGAAAGASGLFLLQLPSLLRGSGG